MQAAEDAPEIARTNSKRNNDEPVRSSKDKEKNKTKEDKVDKRRPKSREGSHKSKDKDKEKSKANLRDEKDGHRKEDKEKTKSKDKDRHKDKEHRDKDKRKDKDRDRDRDRDNNEDKEQEDEDRPKGRRARSSSHSSSSEASRKERQKAIIRNTGLKSSKSVMLNLDISSPSSSLTNVDTTPPPPTVPSLVIPAPPLPLSALPARLSHEPQSIAAVARKPSSNRLNFEKMNATPKKEISSDALLKSFSITQNAPFTKHLKADAPILVKALGLWKDLNPNGETRSRSYSSFSMKDLPITDFAIRKMAEIEAPATEQDQKEAIADFEDWITSWVTKSTHKYLADHLSINEAILKRISSGNLSTLGLRDLPVVRATLRKLNKYFGENENGEYSKSLTQNVSEQVNIAVALEGMHTRKAGPVRVSATYAKLPLQLIEVYRKSCEVALEELRIKETDRYIDGNAKEKLSAWWLSVIQERVDHFLGQLGYDFLTVPQDYTLTPPRSIRRVRGNLNLITRCLTTPSEEDSPNLNYSEGSESQPPSPRDPVDRPVTPLERPTTPLQVTDSRLTSSDPNRPASRAGTWGRSSRLRTQSSEQTIPPFLERTSAVSSPMSSMTSMTSMNFLRNHRESLLQLIDELCEQIYGVIEEFIEEALIVLEDCLIVHMEENGVKTAYDDKIYNKGDREILELDAAEKIIRACVVADLVKTEDVEKPQEHEESKFLLRYRNKENEVLGNLSNLAKDIRYLYRMMELEDDSKVTARLMDAVPVTGLILARMCTLENETRTVLELWEERTQEDANGCESPRAGHYTGYKKFKEGGGEGNILRMLNEGANMQRHGKRRILTTAVHVHVPATLDNLVFSTTDAAHSRVTKQIPVINLKSVELGKTPTFCFHAVDSCCFYIPLQKGNTLNLETKNPLDRDKWVAAFKWLLATRDARAAMK